MIVNWEFAFGAINALGSLATFGAFVFLFIKDKNKQAQLDRLAGIAEHLQNHTGYFKAHADHMQRHNELIEKEIEILTRSILMQEDNSKNSVKLAKIEEKKIRLSVEPKFQLMIGTNGPNKNFNFDLINHGEEATLLSIFSNELSIAKIEPWVITKNAKINFYGSFSYPRGNWLNVPYEIDIEYHDKFGNEYAQKFQCIGSSARAERPQEK